MKLLDSFLSSIIQRINNTDRFLYLKADKRDIDVKGKNKQFSW